MLISCNFLQTPSSDDILAGNFTWSNSIILVESVVRWKRNFEKCFSDHCVGDIGNKNIAGA